MIDSDFLKLLNQSLLKLAKSSTIDQGNLKEVLKEITEVGGQTLNVERCGVWMFTNDQKEAIECLDLYELNKNQHTEGYILFAKDYPQYFKFLSSERFLSADNVIDSPYTKEFTETYLKPLGITSMIDAPFRIKGEIYGVVCFEHIGTPRHWTLEEQTFASSVADFISLVFESHARREAEEKVRRMNEILERKVEKRTLELKKTLEEVKAVKELIDADYYLTSLLIQPLSRTNINLDCLCEVKSFVKQKKTFTFRNKEFQIGGDYVLTEIIYINDNPNVFLINADAMGKSLQGASVILVFASVLKSILLHKNKMKIKSPSHFLRFLYRRFYHFFLSFEGNITISLCMAMISSDGFAYFLSSGHPEPILLRNGKARYLSVFSLPLIGLKENLYIYKNSN